MAYFTLFRKILTFGVFSCFFLVDQVLQAHFRFREYPDDPAHPVYQQYYNMNTKQTLDYVLSQKERYGDLDSYIELTVQEAFAWLKGFVDPSDPDVTFSNDIHNYQTAERCRELLPDCDWFHLIGLLHDIGKILFHFGEPVWAIVGDTFPVGHPFNAKCVYSEFFKDNPDYGKPSIYKEHCGFEKVHLSWGHDEYLYQVLKNNDTSLPDEALYIIRFHSFYPYHKEKQYLELANEKDLTMYRYLKLFNECDLYSKTDDLLSYEDVKDYYDGLIAKYLPKKIKFYRPRA